MSNEIPIVKTLPEWQPTATVEPISEISEVLARKSGGNQSMFCAFHVTQDPLIPNPSRLLLPSTCWEDIDKEGIWVPFTLKHPMFVIRIKFVTLNDKVET
jgi:hypothetical protein